MVASERSVLHVLVGFPSKLVRETISFDLHQVGEMKSITRVQILYFVKCRIRLMFWTFYKSRLMVVVIWATLDKWLVKNHSSG